MAYKWKPSKTARREFAIKMQNDTEREAYLARKKEKSLYENWKDKDFVPTKEQYDFAFVNILRVKDEIHFLHFNMVMSGYSMNDKTNHLYIHTVNQYRRGELLFED